MCTVPPHGLYVKVTQYTVEIVKEDSLNKYGLSKSKVDCHVAESTYKRSVPKLKTSRGIPYDIIPRQIGKHNLKEIRSELFLINGRASTKLDEVKLYHVLLN